MMILPYSLLVLLGISASALTVPFELSHERASPAGKASSFLKQNPSPKPSSHQSLTRLLARKRSAEFVPSDRVYAPMTSFFSKRFPVPIRQDKEGMPSVPRPNIASVQTTASLAVSSNQLTSRKAHTLSFTPGGSAKDNSHATTTTTQSSRSSQVDNGRSTADPGREDIQGTSGGELFLQELIENAVRMLYLSLQSSVPVGYPVPVESAHQVQAPQHGFGFMKRKVTVERKRPFDRLASGLIGKRSVDKRLLSRLQIVQQSNEMRNSLQLPIFRYNL